MRHLVGLALLGAVALAAPARAGSPDAPSVWDLEPAALRTLVAAPQVMVTRTATGWDAYCRCPVALRPDEIPEAMKTAIIAVEDRRYMDHGGVDLIALAGVLRGGLSRGGSTIPMQLLKNLVFHDLRGGDLLSRLERKGSEVWHAGVVDGAVGKQALLAAYLNQIEFGGREIVGLYRASRHYFRKEPRDLTLFECALLAGMVQAPARFNPLKETTRERAYERARLVLALMVRQGRISQAERLRAERAGVRPGLMPEFRIQVQPFTEWIAQTWAPRYVREGETLRFFVTLDPRVQRVAEEALSGMVAAGAIPPEYEAGAVMMTGDGRVRAMIGAVDWARRPFNAAVKTSVQPGSTAKLPLLVAACEAGRAPGSRVVDLPVTASWPSNGALGYRGETTLVEAVASSRNAASVRLTQELGVARVAEASRRLGLDPGPEPDAGFVLGSYSTSVMAVTAAYAAVASGGLRAEPAGVLAVVDGRGQVRANFLDPVRARVVPRRCVAPTRGILREVVRSGTGRNAALGRWEAYGKTGTTTGNADAWFVGWSEGRVLGVWMGRRHDASGEGLAGRGAPAAYFRQVSARVNEMMDARASRRPVRSETPVAGTQDPAGPRRPAGRPPAHARPSPDPAALPKLASRPRPWPPREPTPWFRLEDEEPW
ncbi:Penicillin-binding protein 1F [Methylobacterium crusticola]|uniref:peptidoglycan glycosyltransferase n=1 Tax=Methylobacterium crusticola TaxID=1697972 RepID=A0ABQ4R6J1_9HYPH|nr:transglycosylase domain-containing protein [Methylobacterium crusticola]GJD53042.1 Penicillin-binding protein 1F [Methylobacterium crusticola]